MSGEKITPLLLPDKTPKRVFASGGQERSREALTNSVRSLRAVTKTFTTANRRSPDWYLVKVVWHILDSRINFVKDKTEWNSADIVFEITKKDGKTEPRFTHVGLVLAIECYGACTDAWGFM